jgi:hypothetical protein
MRASTKLAIKKQVEALPDSYGVTFHYIDGKSESFEIASHHLGAAVFEFVTTEDVWHWVKMENVKRVEFDKNFSKIVAIKAKAGN